MSEHEFIIPKRDSQRQSEQSFVDSTIINAYEADQISERVVQDSLRQVYKTLDFPCCGDYIQPNLQPIIKKKRQNSKIFIEANQMQQLHKISSYDGIHDNIYGKQNSANEIIRLKTRLVRDERQQYFQQNSKFIMQHQFFYNHLSRLSNISFIQNQSIKIFQKNAILSQRNNQKKCIPFQLQINLGYLWIIKHQLQNLQQKKFQQLRPMLKQFSQLSTYPTLSEISREKNYLAKLQQQLISNNVSNQQIQQVTKKIDNSNNQYNKQLQKIKKSMVDILAKWKQVKQIRKNTGMETVPWKLNVKQYQIDGQKSFDIGITPIQINDKPHGFNFQAEISRRQSIKQQSYFVRIFINGYQVAKSEKSNLQWPSFRVPINQKFNVTVYSSPSSIQAQIIKSGIINKTIDTINIQLPGQYSKTITASQRRFAGRSFALNGSFVRKRMQQPIQPAGLLIYRIEWKGEGSRMPPVSFKSQQQQQTAQTQKSQDDEIQSLLYDIKDPRIPHRLKKPQTQQMIIKGQGGLLPFIDIQSTRHLLLKLKSRQIQHQKLQIPLTQQQIRKRQDLLNILDNQKQKIIDHIEQNQQIYNTTQGLFKFQDDLIIKSIRQILYKLQFVKINIVKGISSSKYKIVQEIINQYLFQKMESPIVVFFQNLFTQKRKLGPQVTYYLQARNVVDTMEINVHFKSGRNIPIRQSAFAKIRHFQEQFRRNPIQELGQNTDMYANYGQSFYQRPPNMNIQGQRFFVPGMINLNGGRQNLEVSYNPPTLQRNNSYIQMRFKKLIKRTQCFEGPYPQWNQTIQFDYNLKQQQMTIPQLYANNQKLIKLFLFDMIQQSKPTTSIAQARIKKTKYYLGRMDIPISMMVSIPSLTGIFALQRPLITFGYGIKKAGLFDNQIDPQYQSKTVFPQTLTLMSVSIFTDPLIDSIHAYIADRKFITGQQSTLFLQRSSDWLSDLNTTLYIRLWLNNIEGKSIFICRFLSQNIMPPPQFMNSLERCARFVSLIPRKYTCKMMQNTQQFHLTCMQFLNVKMGQDHGILLCNYFNYIDKSQGRGHIESYLAIGKAFPYGKSIFVLRKDTNTGNCQLWDPYAGNCYFLPCIQYETIFCFFKYSKKNDGQNQKQICNMLQLTCIVSSTNVYINIQQTFKPNEIDFDIQNKKLWKHFLTQTMRNQYFDKSIITTIQPDITDTFYDRPKNIQERMSQMETTLYKYIQSNLQMERKKHFKPYTFKINSNVSDLIRNKLIMDCQTFKMDFRITGQQSYLYLDYQHQKGKYPQALQKLEQDKNKIKDIVDPDKTFFGFTLNMPYTTLKDIWQKIQQTQIHLDQTQDIQFVLVVRFFQIACHIFSVWVFVGSIA